MAPPTARSQQLDTPEATGEVRQRLRSEGWRADMYWADVGVSSAPGAVRAADGPTARRTIAYLASMRAVDRGAPRLWKDGDVPAPPEADAREVMIAEHGVDEWRSETFEAPVQTVEAAVDPDADEEPHPVPAELVA